MLKIIQESNHPQKQKEKLRTAFLLTEPVGQAVTQEKETKEEGQMKTEILKQSQ